MKGQENVSEKHKKSNFYLNLYGLNIIYCSAVFSGGLCK